MRSNPTYELKTSGYFAAERNEMLPFVPRSAKTILDVGCGDGTFGAKIKARQSCRITGIEHVASVAEIARAKLDLVITGDANLLSELTLPENVFDCIICNDVLEHLIDPWATVRHLSKLLAPDGCIVASIPNVRHYKVLRDLIQHGRWNYTDKGVLDRTHLRFFTVKTIPDLFEPAGLVIECLQGINGPRRLPFKYALINWLSLGKMADMRFLQYACVARKRPS